MKGVRQTRVSAIDGDCWQAAVATIFECELDDVPQPPFGNSDWSDFTFEMFDPWVAERGFWALAAPIIPDGHFNPDVIWLAATKPGPLGCNHSVVFRGTECVWDPELGRATDRFTPDDIEQGTFFIALDPARASWLAGSEQTASALTVEGR